ncbi:3',5'-cyclic AMP phosphodiesterase CpdA [Actinoalloteichus hoggarensis]|uniref:3',5'-cyclic adenosine monophosphate phosphodiesterase CpdA n=1 Tax=Actinoalloteichus hoggarensis TaxID=1470176 RepID=A0A221W7B4_9PSEU|nr:metallophosphoesterase [Actinoalloteichus hoggarensis]ASO21765.1 3',5'-cyclic adenosine monophosphate phosphodiesterase CpdA [Actinoalloteichus hoggarensis]MBB5922362.1 3',5'-cyclic AMP phosphodiesterase CpdA [Actinoalloteichus hoggarensis]
MVLLAHLSDLHVDETDRAARRVRRVMDHLRSLPRPVDAVLVTGDVTERGTEAEYARAAELLHAAVPVLLCPGNHDERSAFRRFLLDGRAGRATCGDTGREQAHAATETVGPINQVHRIGHSAIVLLDSTIPGSGEGVLTPETLDWLDTTLADLGRTTPVLLALHHPPVDLHHPLPDRYPLRERGALARLLIRHPEIVGVLGGHAHTAAVSTFVDRPVLLAPAVTWTLRMPWEGDDPADRTAPPALAFHILDENARLTTHFRVVP